MTYAIWPGIGLSDTPVDWAAVTGSPQASTRIDKKSERVARPKVEHDPSLGSIAAQIRKALEHGPLTRAEICAIVGVKSDSIRAYLQNDMKHGRVVVIVKEGAYQRFALAEAA